MKIILIGKKVGMTQVYNEAGELIPVTVIEAGPCPVLQVKTLDKDGYHAVQIGFGSKKEKNTSKGQLGHFKNAGVEPLRTIREIRLESASDLQVGSVLTLEDLKGETKVDIIGITKGKGFQGVVKRWNFAGGPASHGSMFHRRGGSYGCRQTPGHVAKGKKMPGHFGTHGRTVQNLKIVRTIPEQNLILVKGSIPGANGDTVFVRTPVKKRKSA
jgi:large subunit ribosomal protein L3